MPVRIIRRVRPLERAVWQRVMEGLRRASALFFAPAWQRRCVFGKRCVLGPVTSLSSSNAYYTARVLMQEYSSTKMGVDLLMSPTAGNAQADFLKGRAAAWLESPSHPGMDIFDTSPAVFGPHLNAGALVRVDTHTTPMASVPLEL